MEESVDEEEEVEERQEVTSALTSSVPPLTSDL